VNEQQHWANASDPSIPASLTPAVAGVLTLHNFIKKPQSHLAKQPVPAQIIPGKRPQVTFPPQNGRAAVNALGPQDYAAIYNINPVYNSGINGGGVSVGVIGRSDLYNGGQDVSDFMALFGLCCSGNFQVFLNGPDPGDLGGGEEVEATLDSTWTKAVAPLASVVLVVSASTNTTDGVDLSEAFIVENNFYNMMTESFSSCELYATDAQLAGTTALAEQAAAQGITYFVSTGDDGAEGCDDPNTPPAIHPISVNLLASTAFNVAVGGTMFNENGLASKYWISTPPISETAISYIPENVWNESSLTNGLWSSSGGASAGNIQSGGTTRGVPKPSWQAGVIGIPQDTVRDLPDVSLTAGAHDPYLLCLDGSCVPDSQGQVFVYFVGGTSASAPSFAGIMALVEQQMLNTGQTARQGQANYGLYRLAASQSIYPSQCNGSDSSLPPASSCIFNDITVGNNIVPGELGTQYAAEAGYDLTTGLGSVNVANLVSNWNTITFNPTSTILTLNDGQPVNITHGQSVPVKITVSPNSGTGIPTGDAIVTDATNPGRSTMELFSLTGGQVLSSTSNLSGGTGYAAARYAGDATYAPSDSNLVPVTVSPEPSTTTLSVLTSDASGNPLNFTGGPFGSFVYLRADVAGKSGFGIPTGFVSFFDGGLPIVNGSSLPVNSQGNTATPNGILNFDTGSHSITASYLGDASFSPGNGTLAISFTIQPGFFAAIPSNQSAIAISAPGRSGSTSVTISSSTGFTGTIALSCSRLPAAAACSFTPSSIVASGTPITTSSTITLTTTAAVALLSPPQSRRAGWFYLGTFLVFSMVFVRSPIRRRRSRILLLAVLIALTPGCGGGGSNNHAPAPSVGTPAGTYDVVVNATSGSMTSTTGFTLFIQ